MLQIACAQVPFPFLRGGRDDFILMSATICLSSFHLLPQKGFFCAACLDEQHEVEHFLSQGLRERRNFLLEQFASIQSCHAAPPMSSSQVERSSEERSMHIPMSNSPVPV